MILKKLKLEISIVGCPNLVLDYKFIKIYLSSQNVSKKRNRYQPTNNL